MSISALGGQSGPSSIQNLLLSDLKNNGLSSDVANQVDSEIKSVVEEQKKSGSTRPSPTDIRAAIDQKLKDDVAAGTLTQDQADSVAKALDQFDQQVKQRHDSEKSGGGSGQAPDPSQLFSKLDSNGDGKLTKDEFVSGRPDNVSEADAGKLYDKIAEKSGAGSSSDGLSQDQFTTGFQAAAPQGGPPPGGGAPPAGGGGGGGSASGDSSSGSSTTVTDVTTTTSADGTKTTVTKYADGSSTTSVTYGKADSSSADSIQSILKALTQGKPNSTDTASYLSKLLSGSLIDTQA